MAEINLPDSPQCRKSRALDELRSLYLQNQVEKHGRRNAVSANELSKDIKDWKKSRTFFHVLVACFGRASKETRILTFSRKNSWSDHEMYEIAKAQWPLYYKKLSCSDDDSLSVYLLEE